MIVTSARPARQPCAGPYDAGRRRDRRVPLRTLTPAAGSVEWDPCRSRVSRTTRRRWTPPSGCSANRWSSRWPRESRRWEDFRRLATVQTFGASWPRGGLDDRSRALVSVAIAAALGTHEPLRGQLRIALHSGVTKEEIVELFIHLSAYAGAARAFDSYQIALQVFAEPG
jgi:4-carboxymuconolactone decarboxylase